MKKNNFKEGAISGVLLMGGTILSLYPLFLYNFGWNGGIIDVIVSMIIGIPLFIIGFILFWLNTRRKIK